MPCKPLTWPVFMREAPAADVSWVFIMHDGTSCGGAGIFKALSPHYLFLFFIRNGFAGWVALGGTLLCVTGSEALYADVGHFSKASIRVQSPFQAKPCMSCVQALMPLQHKRRCRIGALQPPFFGVFCGTLQTCKRWKP